MEAGPRTCNAWYAQNMGTSLSVFIALVVLAIFVSGLRIAREYQRAVVFRLGRYNSLRGPGLFWLIPLGIENETRIDLRIVTIPSSNKRP